MLAFDRLRGGAPRLRPLGTNPFGETCRRLGVVFDVLLGEKCSRPAGAKARWHLCGKAAKPGNIRSARTNANPKDGR